MKRPPAPVFPMSRLSLTLLLSSSLNALSAPAYSQSTAPASAPAAGRAALVQDAQGGAVLHRAPSLAEEPLRTGAALARRDDGMERERVLHLAPSRRDPAHPAQIARLGGSCPPQKPESERTGLDRGHERPAGARWPRAALWFTVLLPIEGREETLW